MRLIGLFFLSIVACCSLFAAPHVIASSCADKFSLLWKFSPRALKDLPPRSLPLFNLNEKYLVLMANADVPISCEYRGTKMIAKEPHLTFKRSDGTLFTAKRDELYAAVKLSDFEKASQTEGDALGEILELNLVGNLIAYPFKQLARRGSVNIVGKALTTKDFAEKVAAQIGHFDDSAVKMGFRLPLSTRIVLNERPILPSINGPLAISVPIFNIRDGLKDSTIAMNPIFFNRASTNSQSGLWHERVHTLLHSTYSDKGFVHSNTTVNEALADFMSAHLSGDPGIVLGGAGKDRYIRNIEFAEAAPHRSGPQKEGARPRRDIFDFKSGSNHENSLLFSNALWQIRQRIGKTEMDRLFKPFLDDLNLHRKSAELPTDLKGAAKDVSDFKYFLASIKRTAEDMGTGTEINPLIHEIALQRKLLPKEINEIASRLIREGNFDARGRKIGVSIYAHAGAATTLTGEGYLIYNFVAPSSSDK